MSDLDDRSAGGRADHPAVALLLVSHDGARWLPAVLEGVRAQQVPIAVTVGVDTHSADRSGDLLEAALDTVVHAPGGTTFPGAVELGLERLREVRPDAEWVWILHDDANPHRDALLALTLGTLEYPDADVLGPQLREWPSLLRLLELGVTISGTGRRETGLERGEYDQGQYVEGRTVLAVNTAGMLVRRSVLEELGGFDDELPIFGNDIDFGWRAAAAGHRTVVVPQAVVFHAEAAHRGLRRTPLTGRHTHYQERRAAIFTLLANRQGWFLPLQVLRLTLGTLVRMAGFLLVRSPGEALDDLAALVSVLSGPRAILAARRRRRAHRRVEPAALRRLLAPRWLPYRHGLDVVTDVLAALTRQASDVAERRRAAKAEQDPSSFAARRPDPADRDVLEDDGGILVRFLTNPVAVLLAAFVLVGLGAAHGVLGAVSGGGLSPTPDGVGAWWRLHVESWHPLGQGTPVPAPAYLLPLALLATVLLGSTTAAVSSLLVLAVPAALWGAWRFLRVVGRLATPTGAPRWLILWGAATYSLAPVVSGAWGDGRLGPVVAAVLLPWLAHAALGFADPEADRRWRAAWRAGLLLAVTTAFTPVAFVFAAALGLVVVGAAFAIVPAAARDRSTWGPPVTAVLLVPVLLAPWWLPSLVHGAGAALLLDAGRLPAPGLDGVDLVLGRLHDLGAPGWWGLVLPVLAVVAVVPRRTRIPVLIAWIVAVVAAVAAAVLATVSLDLASVSVPVGLGFLLVVLQAAFVVAVVMGALGPATHGVRSWRRVPAGVLAIVALAVPVGGLGWFVVHGNADLAEGRDAGIPAYMVQSSMLGPEHGILVVRGDVADGLTYTVRRGDGITLGEDEIIALSPEDTGLTRQVRELAARPTPAVVDELADRGIEYVVLPGPADPDVAASLDATGGLVQASAENRTTRAWQIDRPLAPDAVSGPRDPLRIALLVLQGLGVLVVLVLCAPTTNRSRR